MDEISLNMQLLLADLRNFQRKLVTLRNQNDLHMRNIQRVGSHLDDLGTRLDRLRRELQAIRLASASSSV